MSAERCPRCNAKVKVAPGIGPYCPNNECPVLDNIRAWEPRNIKVHAKGCVTMSVPPAMCHCKQDGA